MILIETLKEKCKHCLACIRTCPVKALKANKDNGYMEVFAEKCIYCGQCIISCAQEAKIIKGDIERLKNFLKSKKKLVAILTPEYIASFHPISPLKVKAGLKKLGFSAVEETTLGEELVASAYLKYFRDSPNYPIIRTTCPVVTKWFKKNYPNFLKFLAPIVSPLIATGKVAKEKYGPDAITVAISSCIAQKAEAIEEEVVGSINLVLTFKELKKIFKDKHINLESLSSTDFPEGQLILPRMSSVASGFPREILKNYNLIDREIKVVRGVNKLEKLVSALSQNEISLKLVDALNCESCADGPGIDSKISLYARRNLIENYYQEKLKNTSPKIFQEFFSRLPSFDLKRTFLSEEFFLPLPTENDIQNILIQEEKYSNEDLLNCRACGYDTCRQKAIAIYQGLADLEMCFPFQKKMLLKTVSHLKSLSRTDSLTGVLNHKAFIEELSTEFSRSKRYKLPLSLLMIDIDSFKEINDQFGHPFGDKILKGVARVLKENTRSSDIVARYGGDEFAIILPHIEEIDAFAVGEKLRKAVSELRIDNGSNFRVSISVGIFSVHEEMEIAEELLEEADKALYRAKEAGKNQTWLTKIGQIFLDLETKMSKEPSEKENKRNLGGKRNKRSSPL